MSDQTSDATTDQTSETELHTESHDPAVPAAYSAFMRQGWGDRELDLPRPSDHAVGRGSSPAARRGLPGRTAGAAGGQLQGALLRHRLPLPPRHRPHLLLRQPDQRRRARASTTASRVLYARPRSERTTDEFFRDRQYGELWVGRRPSLKEISDSLGLEVRHIDQLGRRPLPAAARPASTVASPRPSTGWWPRTSAATPTSPASPRSCD